ncbi:MULTISPECIES: phycobilisome linker polypeptide [Cyanophyceae]|uniref:phycobilisome linker polypeptide n=1 Tax=Cyanophyceae TaxID=3028117 RepID=UPI0016828032|nr:MULTISPECIES: phycobilisome linker polypeptide [Cyanophyceae]MBD1916344.1 phycobilisome linker polypeptide [Phormidium sp. FACHB-77]MBD2032636.1 phycobilisome linker polypeptide [Phormidium sp. FACHB-322]MBD2050008.1 phycobilisome linker polypeptide [Leptolyngbya sp. FACHB-60]
MAVTTAAGRLGVSPYDESMRIELRPNWIEGDVEAVIRAAYRQVFGNQYIMASERNTSAESLLQQGAISVRDFVRALALSDLYRDKFFLSGPQNRFIELNYKHLLGRAPYGQDEIAFHTDLYNTDGYAAEINSYIDSQEYRDNFGDNVVPYYRGHLTQRSQKTVGFTRFFQLYRGYGTSDRAQGSVRSRLVSEIAKNSSSPVGSGATGAAIVGGSGGDREKLYRVRVTQATVPGRPQVRRICTEFLVPYEQLSRKLQQVNRSGGRVTKVDLA